MSSEHLSGSFYSTPAWALILSILADSSLSPMDKKRTIDDRMKLYPGFDGILEWLYKHGLEA